MSLNVNHLPPLLFAELVSLEMLHLERNNIQELPSGIFRTLENLRDLYVYQNNLTVIESNSFGSLSSLRTLNVQSNRVDAIEASFFEATTSLNSLFMLGNLCNQQNFFNVQGSREDVRRHLQNCFHNFVRLTGLIECNYIDVQPYGYFCELSIVNVFQRDFERIEGEHQQGRNDSDVFRVEAMEQETFNIPTIICETFNKLRELVFIESDVEFVTPEAIERCVNLELFSMEVNKIKVLPDGLFINAPNLQVADFYWNEISEIGESAFAGTNIWAVELECE
jgi:Leucine-rich repeat (LRR) protein